MADPLQQPHPIDFDAVSGVTPGDDLVVHTAYATDPTAPQRAEGHDNATRHPEYLLAGTILEIDNWQSETDVEQLVAQHSPNPDHTPIATIAFEPTLLWQLHNGETTDVSDRLVGVNQTARESPSDPAPEASPPCHLHYCLDRIPRCIVPELQASGVGVHVVSRGLGRVIDCAYGETVDPTQLLPAGHDSPETATD